MGLQRPPWPVGRLKAAALVDEDGELAAEVQELSQQKWADVVGDEVKSLLEEQGLQVERPAVWCGSYRARGGTARSAPHTSSVSAAAPILS